MYLSWILLVGGTLAELPVGETRIAGIVVNGSRLGEVVPGVEVVLRAGEESELAVVAVTTSDARGRFVFTGEVSGARLVFLPGANFQGVHYPGARFRWLPGQQPNPVTLTVFETVAEPSPLIAPRHVMDIRIKPGIIEVTEILTVSNPTLTTYVGEPAHNADGDPGPRTLRLGIPDTFTRVNFHQEFFGRRFKLVDKALVTYLPWTPGTRELGFTYFVPLEKRQQVLQRILDLDCPDVKIRITGEKVSQIACSLPRTAANEDGTVAFASLGKPLRAGTPIVIHLEGLPVPWLDYARWVALGTLVMMISATAVLRRRRRLAKPVLPPPLEKGRPSLPPTGRLKMPRHRRRRSRAA